MKTVFVPIVVTLIVGGTGLLQAGRQSQPAAAARPQPSREAHRALLDQYCVTCHNEKLKTANLLLDKLDLAQVGAEAATWERVVAKVRAGMMPPAGARRPDRAALDGMAAALEGELDRAASVRPNPGWVPLHRLNRAEYANAIRDLLNLDVDPTALPPTDNSSHGFDNIAAVLGVSPALLERYVAAAAKISRVAVGSREISPLATTYRVRGDLTQSSTVDGLPMGTRGGTTVRHNFPLDGEYVIKLNLARMVFGNVYGGSSEGELLEVTLDGKRIKLYQLDAVPFFGLTEVPGQELPPLPLKDPSAERIKMTPALKLELRVPISAGPHAVGVAFPNGSYAAVEDLVRRPTATTRDLNAGTTYGYQTVPHLSQVDITGPYNATGSGDTPSRRRIFVCRPSTAAEELPCARRILSSLVRRAFRRPAVDADVQSLLVFYQQGRAKGSFDAGIEMALRTILADPEFVIRFERPPAGVSAGEVYRLSDLELASRLSFFVWSSIPDDELLTLASQGKLRDPKVLEQQTRRMLKDPKARALATNFAGQWLFLRDLKNTSPDRGVFKDFDDNLRQAFLRETELLFDDIVREDRSVLHVLDADYTYVNERLAKHYGIQHVYGPDFRRVPVPSDARRGVLGQGSILMVTSNPNRTSPVIRGKWILENILGTPAPLPPPNVPALAENTEGVKPTTVRERLEQHRQNPACAGCHRIMDPIGLALENFDGVGQWRTTDAGAPIDPSSALVDGTRLDGPASLRNALLNRPEAVVGTMTQKLLMYAAGRETTDADMPVVRAILRRGARDGYRFSSLVLGIVQSAPFQMNVHEPLAEQRRATN